MIRITLQVFVLLSLSACASQEPSVQTYRDKRGLSPASVNEFDYCHGYGCKFIKKVSLTSNDWRAMKKIFTPRPATPEKEREVLKTAIAQFERWAGARTKTAHDRAGTFKKLGDDQLDCVDESTNTTTYLDLLLQKGLLRFHKLEAPSMRYPIINAGRWPHQTAVIQETQSGERYAVDSWFRDNGQPADIISLKQWKDGWKPKNLDDSWL